MQDEMISSLVRQATDPVQYDHGNIDWIKHGTITNPLRIFFLGALYAAIGDLAGKSVLEIGSGTGWLLDDFLKHGKAASVLGVEPSVQNVQYSRSMYPDVPTVHSSLRDFSSTQRFDAVALVMVTEHLLDLQQMFAQLNGLLSRYGKIAILTFNSDYARTPRFDYEIVACPLEETDTWVVKTARPSVRGSDTLYDIVRTPAVFKKHAEAAGLRLTQHVPLKPTPEFLAARSKYSLFADTVMYDLFVFEKGNIFQSGTR